MALTVVAGVGGVVALVVAYRKQRVTESAETREHLKLPNERFGAACNQNEPDVESEWYHDAESEVRLSITSVIAQHLRDGALVSWQGHDFDLVRAVLRSADFSGIRMSSGTFFLSLARFPGGWISFDGLKVSGGEVWFGGATFEGARVTFDNAEFTGGRMKFEGAEFNSGEVSFRGARFAGGEVDCRRRRSRWRRCSTTARSRGSRCRPHDGRRCLFSLAPTRDGQPGPARRRSRSSVLRQTPRRS